MESKDPRNIVTVTTSSKKDTEDDNFENINEEEVFTDYGCSIMNDVIQYCESNTFQLTINEFIEKYLYLFSTIQEQNEEQKDMTNSSFSGVEHKIEYTIAHQKYQDLVESLLSDFIGSDLNSSVNKFYAECRDIIEGKFCPLFEEHEHKWFVDAMLSWVDYENFYIMMIEHSSLKSCRK